MAERKTFHRLALTVLTNDSACDSQPIRRRYLGQVSTTPLNGERALLLQIRSYVPYDPPRQTTGAATTHTASDFIWGPTVLLSRRSFHTLTTSCWQRGRKTVTSRDRRDWAFAYANGGR